ncbi:MAG TPA: SDR family NAD(P)-dependent oxidoreductase [Burkholderiaceae bacterium]|jgi:NAD(P)-dependent dehydrogenase (short-subunit alcohol dehydrogenase family)|nr:SDR family NAD(P)-dependent oxidoreductase [Burkholderiaceae bacterium]
MASRNLTLLTGASRGMGAAIAEQLLQPGATLVCLSRTTNAGLAAKAAAAGASLEQWALDLADAAAAARRVEDWLAAQPGEAFDSATLVNNAAALTSSVPLEAVDAQELARALRVGLEAPLLLTSAFLRATATWRARRDGRCKVLNISSGLGRSAMASQAGYCAVKAGLDHFSRSVALDQSHAPHPARIVSLAPGVIDTDMQVRLRGGDPAQFPDVARFQALKSGGHLDSPAAAAAKVIAYLQRPDFGTQPVADVRG